MTKLAVVIGFLCLNFYVYHAFATERVIPQRTSLFGFPLQVGDWHCDEPERIDAPTLENLGVTDYLACTYERGEPRAHVSLYVGYHETQVREEGGGSKENSIHPPKHCLPGSGWDIIQANQVELDLPGLPQRPAKVNRFVIAKGDLRQIVYYWYQGRDRVIADDWMKILDLVWDRATLRRTDGSLIRFTVPLVRGDEERAEESFRSLASEILPRLPQYVPGREAPSA